jgi:RimJ/RimL family protein N-acetyltransferase
MRRIAIGAAPFLGMAYCTAVAESLLPLLESERLRLRGYRMQDLDAVLALYSDPRVMRYWSFPPWREPAQARAYLERAMAECAAGAVLAWALADRASDLLIGTATLHSLHREQGRAELGYSLSPQWQGRGLASEALRLVIGHAFGPMRLRRLEADVDPRNLPSCRLLERLGFHREGLLRARWRVAGEDCDSAMYGLLAHEHAGAPAADADESARACS